MTKTRREELKAMLEERRRGIRAGVDEKIRSARSGAGAEVDKGVGSDDLEVNVEDIDFALLQIKAQTADRITDALARLASGEYGQCTDCDEEIPETRLRALPFATRCRVCQESVEAATRRTRRSEARGTSMFGFGFGAIQS